MCLTFTGATSYELDMDLWERISLELQRKGIDLAALCGPELDASRLKVVCLTAGLDSSLSEMTQATRDRVVMVRVDEETSEALDKWVESGVVKSRSEAAALFIREGLGIRSGELEQLAGALREVEEAKQRLKKKARDVLGPETVSEEE